MDESNGWLVGAAVAVFALGVVLYVFFMIFFPEWVGISGKVASKAEESHQSGSVTVDDDLTAKLQRKSRDKNTPSS